MIELTAAQWRLLDRIGQGQLVLTPANELKWQDAGNLVPVTGKENEDLRRLYRKDCIIFPLSYPYHERSGLVAVQISELVIKEQWEWQVFGPDPSM